MFKHLTTLDKIWWLYMAGVAIAAIYTVSGMIISKRRERAERASYERYLHNTSMTIEQIQAELEAWDKAS